MRFDRQDPPRRFTVGNAVKFDMKDCGTLSLEPDEQITLVTPGGGQYDVARKHWGFYATPSLNGRLEQFGLRAVLVRNTITDRYFVLLVERGCETAFDTYRAQECLEVVSWLDGAEALARLRTALGCGD